MGEGARHFSFGRRSRPCRGLRVEVPSFVRRARAQLTRRALRNAVAELHRLVLWKNGEKVQQIEGSELLQEYNVLRGHAGNQELQAISMGVGLSRHSLCSGLWRICLR
eukprot:6183793-Pyramimonas_sp.AAC.1